MLVNFSKAPLRIHFDLLRIDAEDCLLSGGQLRYDLKQLLLTYTTEVTLYRLRTSIKAKKCALFLTFRMKQ